MNQSRGLQRMAFALMAHLTRGDSVKFPINQTGNFIARFPVAVSHPVQERCDARRLDLFRLFEVCKHFESVYSGPNQCSSIFFPNYEYFRQDPPLSILRGAISDPKSG